MGRGQGIDMRAEEEAARRAVRSNVGNIKFAGSLSRARRTDLFGEQALRARLNHLGWYCLLSRLTVAHKHKISVDDEAMRYLALAAEIRVRTMLSSAIRAQQHRVTSTHQHKPPMTKAHGSKLAEALWSQKVTSDPHAVMQALANANREENKAHRVERTERKARDTELARAAAAAREREGEPPEASSSAGAGSDTEATPSVGSAPPAARTPREPTFQAAPTFGAPPPARKSGKTKKANPRDFSADVQAKLTNATALMAAGKRKRYAWEVGAMSGAFRPQVPSLLSGKRKKGGEEEKEKEGEPEVVAPQPKRPKRTISGPHRRQIDLEVEGDKKGRDDKALTIVDVLFALEHEGSGRGPGTTEDVVRKYWTKPGGPYGKW